MNFDLFPQPTRLGHRSQIKEGLVLRPFSYYIKSSFKVCSVFGAKLTEHKDPWVVWRKETPTDTVSIFSHQVSWEKN
jgi:hypothetical protein